jgi:hypothetical protein
MYKVAEAFASDDEGKKKERKEKNRIEKKTTPAILLIP